MPELRSGPTVLAAVLLLIGVGLGGWVGAGPLAAQSSGLVSLGSGVVGLDSQVVRIDARVVGLDPRVEPLEVAATPKQSTIVVGADILFAFNSADLSPDAVGQLSGVVARIQAQRVTAVTVDGHTDSVGDAAYNQTLSERRAAAVAQALRNQVGPSVAVSSHGFGETQPLADDRNGADAQAALRNRRVTITLTSAG